MKIESNLFKDIQIAVLRNQLFNMQAEEFKNNVKRALIAAGLDSNKSYNLNELDETVEEQ